MTVSTNPTTPPAKSPPEPKWTVLIGERYEYTREWKTAKVTVKTADGKKREEWKTGYFVHCLDTVKPEHHMDHGPFTLEQANAMMRSRIERDKELKRDR